MEIERPNFEIVAPTVLVTVRGPEAHRFVNFFRDIIEAYYGRRLGDGGSERIVFVERLARMQIEGVGLTPYEKTADDELRAVVAERSPWKAT